MFQPTNYVLAEELEIQERNYLERNENNELKTVGYKSWVSGFSLECYGICMKMIQQKN